MLTDATWVSAGTAHALTAPRTNLPFLIAALIRYARTLEKQRGDRGELFGILVLRGALLTRAGLMVIRITSSSITLGGFRCSTSPPYSTTRQWTVSSIVSMSVPERNFAWLQCSSSFSAGVLGTSAPYGIGGRWALRLTHLRLSRGL